MNCHSAPSFFTLLLCAGLLVLTMPGRLHAETFMSLRSDNINMRVGPGKIYPIIWNYRSRGMPVAVIGKHNDWLQVRDMEGETGWMYHRLLSTVRTAAVNTDNVLLYSHPDNNATVIAKIMQHVVMIPSICRLSWCKVSISHDGRITDGWIRKHYLWGIGGDEIFEE